MIGQYIGMFHGSPIMPSLLARVSILLRFSHDSTPNVQQLMQLHMFDIGLHTPGAFGYWKLNSTPATFNRFIQ